MPVCPALWGFLGHGNFSSKTGTAPAKPLGVGLQCYNQKSPRLLDALVAGSGWARGWTLLWCLSVLLPADLDRAQTLCVLPPVPEAPHSCCHQSTASVLKLTDFKGGFQGEMRMGSGPSLPGSPPPPMGLNQAPPFIVNPLMVTPLKETIWLVSLKQKQRTEFKTC